jgi:hypothetical protein
MEAILILSALPLISDRNREKRRKYRHTQKWCEVLFSADFKYNHGNIIMLRNILGKKIDVPDYRFNEVIR